MFKMRPDSIGRVAEHVHHVSFTQSPGSAYIENTPFTLSPWAYRTVSYTIGAEALPTITPDAGTHLHKALWIYVAGNFPKAPASTAYDMESEMPNSEVYVNGAYHMMTNNYWRTSEDVSSTVLAHYWSHNICDWGWGTALASGSTVKVVVMGGADTVTISTVAMKIYAFPAFAPANSGCSFSEYMNTKFSTASSDLSGEVLLGGGQFYLSSYQKKYTDYYGAHIVDGDTVPLLAFDLATGANYGTWLNGASPHAFAARCNAKCETTGPYLTMEQVSHSNTSPKLMPVVYMSNGEYMRSNGPSRIVG